MAGSATACACACTTIQKRNFKKDIEDVLLFCKDKGFSIQIYGLNSDLMNIANKLDSNSRYIIRRQCTDGDEITYYLMDTHIDEDFCDEYIEIFNIPIDFYDIQTNLVEELKKECVKYGI